jgi:hypothetical protein
MFPGPSVVTAGMTWSEDELDRIGGATELRLASYRPDGSLRPYVTIWVVRAGDDLYVRSAYGPGNGWFVRATASGRGRVAAGGVEHDVTFEPAPADAHDAIDAAYHEKYDSHGAAIVSTVVGEKTREVTLKLASWTVRRSAGEAAR